MCEVYSKTLILIILVFVCFLFSHTSVSEVIDDAALKQRSRRCQQHKSSPQDIIQAILSENHSEHILQASCKSYAHNNP